MGNDENHSSSAGRKPYAGTRFIQTVRYTFCTFAQTASQSTPGKKKLMCASEMSTLLKVQRQFTMLEIQYWSIQLVSFAGLFWRNDH